MLVTGAREDALEVRRRLTVFLRGSLGLKLSLEKTRVTHLRSEPARFLGFLLSQHREPLLLPRRDLNPLGQRDGRPDTRHRGWVHYVGYLRVLMPTREVMDRLLERGLARRWENTYRPTSCKRALVMPLDGVVRYLGAVFRGLARYYGVADNWRAARELVNYFGRYCAAATLAHKTRSRIPKIFRRYGFSLEIRGSKGEVLTRWPTIRRREELGPSLLRGRR